MHVALINVRKYVRSANNSIVYDKVITGYFHGLSVNKQTWTSWNGLGLTVTNQLEVKYISKDSVI